MVQRWMDRGVKTGLLGILALGALFHTAQAQISDTASPGALLRHQTDILPLERKLHTPDMAPEETTIEGKPEKQAAPKADALKVFIKDIQVGWGHGIFQVPYRGHHTPL